MRLGPPLQVLTLPLLQLILLLSVFSSSSQVLRCSSVAPVNTERTFSGINAAMPAVNTCVLGGGACVARVFSDAQGWPFLAKSDDSLVCCLVRLTHSIRALFRPCRWACFPRRPMGHKAREANAVDAC